MKKINVKKFPKLPSLRGISIRSVCVGIKSKSKLDLSVVVFEEYANVAYVLTKSKTCAANILWLNEIEKHGKAKILLVNSGNANAYTGKQGYQNVKKLVNFFSGKGLIKSSEVIISSTGVIGEQLPIEKIIYSISTLFENKLKFYTKLMDWKLFATSICTTDTFPKAYSLKSKIGDKLVNIIGIAKGSGMIAPDMATMLGFIFTDASIPRNILKQLLQEVAEKTFNSITVDSDTSTNDMVCFFSTRKVNCKIRSKKDKSLTKFKKDLERVAENLAKKIILDGEGATKFIEVNVKGAKSYSDAKKVALSIANSPLVKTAIAGEDANWGRIIMAIGKANVTLNQNKISLKFGDILVIKNGALLNNYQEKKLSKYLKSKEIIITANLSLGKGNSKVWTCDLTKEYIRINAEYRT